jgi:hypothetical protein
METIYYEVFNQSSVTLIDVNETSIGRITATGIVVAGEERPFDIIIFATGFDAVRGAFDWIAFRGLGGIPRL